MANKDKTGPNGQGPMTGRGMGPCNENVGQEFGRGRGCGRGRGMGMFCPAMAPLTKEEEKKVLEAELKYAQEYIEELKKKLE